MFLEEGMHLKTSFEAHEPLHLTLGQRARSIAFDCKSLERMAGHVPPPLS